MSRLDLVIFGASGFTGKHAVEEMVRLAKKYPGMTWGVAGRSEKKLQEIMAEAGNNTGEDLSSIQIIIADVKDEESLNAMCSRAAVLVNCCGPYWLYGEPVVRAAIHGKCHYVDVSGEPHFMEKMQLQYDAQARDAGVYVISACGFDSIPNDLGVIYLQNNFRGTLNSVESYISAKMDTEKVPLEDRKNGVIHYGTWESLVYGISNWDKLRPLRAKLFPESLPPFKPRLPKRSVCHQYKGRWCVPFPGADASVVYRSQRHLHAAAHSRPAQFRAYVQLPSLLWAVLTLLLAAVLLLLSKWRVTRQLLLANPRLFSAGAITREGPSRSAMDNTKFRVELVGRGWDNGVDVDTAAPNKTVVAKVSGVNPGYGATVTALLLSALTVRQQYDKMPLTGGVLTTGAAFKNTSLIEMLNDNNLTFEIVESKVSE